MVSCLKRGADCLHVVQMMPLPSQNPAISCLIKIQTSMVLRFSYQLTQLVLEPEGAVSSYLRDSSTSQTTGQRTDLGGMSQTAVLTLFGIHSTKYELFLFCTFSICSSTCQSLSTVTASTTTMTMQITQLFKGRPPIS